MSNRFGKDILLQAPEPAVAAAFYVDNLNFEITNSTPDVNEPDLIELAGPAINLYIERGPALGPVLEVFVESVAAARDRILAAGGRVLKDEPQVPRCYVQDPNGLVYNLNQR